jgi:hypothetical protein
MRAVIVVSARAGEDAARRREHAPNVEAPLLSDANLRRDLLLGGGRPPGGRARAQSRWSADGWQLEDVEQ